MTGRYRPFRSLTILLVALGLGMPLSFLASSYAHHREHRWVAPTDQQYEGYSAGFAFGHEHPMPNAEVANFDYCDAAAHRLNRTTGKWMFFSQGCQEATSWTPGDPPPQPLSRSVFQANPL